MITNVGFDHTDGSGDWRRKLAWEKAGIIKKDSILCLGETDEKLEELFLAESPRQIYRRNIDFECVENDLAVGGRQLSLRSLEATYENIFLRQHGRHQGNNASIALAAAEAFLESELPEEIVNAAFADVNLPGRFEVLNSSPLFVLDGAHNPPGAIAAAQTLKNGFAHTGKRVLIVGMTEEKDAQWMLNSFEAEQYDLVVCTQAESPRSMPAEELSNIASSQNQNVLTCAKPEDALEKAFEYAREEDVILGSGSMYVVGALREAFESYE